MLKTLVVLFAVVASACQQSAQPKPETEASPALGFPARGVFSHKLKIEATYDRFKDRTKIQIEHDKIFESNDHSISLSASSSFDGKQIVAVPDGVVLRVSKNWRGSRPVEPDCVFLADGRRIQDERHTTEPAEPGLNGWQSQIAYYAFSIRPFVDLVNASLVEGRCWGGEFPIRGEITEALRDFASRLNPAPTNK